MTGAQNSKIYLDYSATAPARAEVIVAVADSMAQPHNPSSVHAQGRAAHKIIEDAREKIAAFVNLPPAQIIFNSGATEGNNTVLKFFRDERVLVSATEHPSVLEAAPKAGRIPVHANGLIDLHALGSLLKHGKTGLVSVMLVNNETGVIQPVQDIAALAHRYGALFHCDAAQAAGRIKLDAALAGIDFLTLSAHKIGGPQGVGALCLGLCGITPVLLEGGGQEKRARAGTHNTAGILGFGIAADLAERDLKHFLRLESFRDKIEAALNGVAVHGLDAPRVANTTLFSVPNTTSETLLMAFDLEGICLSNGSACSSGSVKPSHVLAAMGAEPAGTLRISTGWATAEADIDAFLAAWQKIAARLQIKPER
jgi:cysteine desulfurase